MFGCFFDEWKMVGDLVLWQAIFFGYKRYCNKNIFLRVFLKEGLVVCWNGE